VRGRAEGDLHQVGRHSGHDISLSFSRNINLTQFKRIFAKLGETLL
jgi:hypothetical protein